MEIVVLIASFLVVFALNVIPILGPPTWMTLSFIALLYPIQPVMLFIFVAICAATLGRFVLTLLSKNIIRERLLSKRYLKNVNYLKRFLEKNKKIVSIIFLIEAFTPFPSDQFFVAYGMTGLKARYALIPFALGRIFTYSFWVLTATQVSKQIAASSLSDLSFLSWPFILAEAAFLCLVLIYVRIDWKHMIEKRKFRFLRK
jgi:membrane protein YqaA with SNARE-associated domain